MADEYELNCYDYERIRIELVEADDIVTVRYWPRDLYDQQPWPLRLKWSHVENEKAMVGDLGCGWRLESRDDPRIRHEHVVRVS